MAELSGRCASDPAAACSGVYAVLRSGLGAAIYSADCASAIARSGNANGTIMLKLPPPIWTLIFLVAAAALTAKSQSETDVQWNPSPHREMRPAEGCGKCAVQHRVTVSQ